MAGTSAEETQRLRNKASNYGTDGKEYPSALNEEDEENMENDPYVQMAPVMMYVSHFLSAFDDRVWQFAVPVLLMNVWTQTLFPSAAIAFATNIVTFILMPYVGAYVDCHDRLDIMIISIVAESCFIVVAAVLLCFVAKIGETNGGVPSWDFKETSLFIALCLANAATEVSMRVGQQSLEKDWAVVVSKTMKRDPTRLNTSMRRIDLGCKLVGPACFGLFVQYVNGDTAVEKVVHAAIALSVWNIFVMPAEYFTVRKVYYTIPALQRKELKKHGVKSPLTVLREGWSSYMSHEVFVPSFTYGLLWFTVLDNGVLMTAYLKWQGIPEGPLGISRGCGAVVGILGTIVYPKMLDAAGGSVLLAGKWAIWLFVACLFPIGLVFLDMGPHAVSAGVMIIAVTVSRAWLWAFDLTIQRILQDSVHENERGVINGVHTAVTQLMLVAASVVGMIFSQPSQFTILVITSLFSVALAAMWYTRWANAGLRTEAVAGSKYEQI
eukprot:TRINITY_DN30536_c0_g1_i1.p1 TRINITY_DN30536_c0_g1~~TRINITY_DN30536_c0_g1_i1.p1  ORF type:complete len:494 (+),score=103.04 TRINITY_DN30536_c0_g1_i1:58-1539(+)